MTDLPAERPAGFELPRAWDRVVEEVERQRSLTSASVLIDAGLLPVLRAQFGRHCTVEAELGDGRVRARVAAPTPLAVAQHLAGWGATVDVVEPEPVRVELARIGAELTARYTAPPPG
ncbi:WYL domain-containing protein [Allosalinactinospora lopnorensis]|nr:WYL domain-containing protein [Allosalinactinospora lopnorensis]